MHTMQLRLLEKVYFVKTKTFKIQMLKHTLESASWEPDNVALHFIV